MNTTELLTAARERLTTDPVIANHPDYILSCGGPKMAHEIALPSLDLLGAVLRGQEPHEYDDQGYDTPCRVVMNGERCDEGEDHPLHSDAAAAYVAALRTAVE